MKHLYTTKNVREITINNGDTIEILTYYDYDSSIKYIDIGGIQGVIVTKGEDGWVKLADEEISFWHHIKKDKKKNQYLYVTYRDRYGYRETKKVFKSQFVEMKEYTKYELIDPSSIRTSTLMDKMSIVDFSMLIKDIIDNEKRESKLCEDLECSY